MLKHIRYAALIVAINVASGISFGQGNQPIAEAEVAVGPSRPVETLSVLTYNIRGLPWPVTSGRGAAMDAIADRLIALRQRGAQPHIVLLQEAFTDEARAIGTRAGYRTVAFGPDAGQAPDYVAGTPLARDWMRGEAIGKRLNSGLAILSDFPIASVETLAFGDQACAGFDCLANKGVMMAVVHIPGQSEPVRIFNTHLNSRKAAGVSVAKANRAFERQLHLASRFIRARIGSSSLAIVAGDFNIGKDGERRAAFASLSASGRLPAFLALEQASGTRALNRGVVAGAAQRADLRAVVRRTKDLMFASPTLSPVRAAVPFGREASGTSLSDHFGYQVDYALSPRPSAAPLQIAANAIPSISRKAGVR